MILLKRFFQQTQRAISVFWPHYKFGDHRVIMHWHFITFKNIQKYILTVWKYLLLILIWDTVQVWRSSGHNALTLHHLQKHTKIYTYCMKIFVTNSDMRHSAVVAISTAIVTRTAPQKLNLALLNILKTCIQTLPYARFYSNSVRWLRSC